MKIYTSLILWLVLGINTLAAQTLFHGTLKVHPDNPRYFTDNNNEIIYLTGSHTWENLQDMNRNGESHFDYEEYLDMMEQHGHNFMRMWMFEQAKMASWTSDSIVVNPLPFRRTGPGIANDGLLKFDLTTYNPVYFDRLRHRVMKAGEKGIYVSVMLFQGWCLDRTSFGIGDPFPYLPYHSANNINKISAPRTNEDFDDKPSLHSLKISSQLYAVQKEYVKKVIETVNDLDNILYEIINEGGATDWQYEMIRFIKETEAKLPKQHPVGMTHRGDKIQRNEDLFSSPADWISPNHQPLSWKQGDSVRSTSFKYDPPAATGAKVILNDTDHLWGHGGNHKWVWKSFLRGLNPIFMDPWSPLPGKKDDERTAGWLFDAGGISKDDRNYPDYELIRKSMGYTRAYAQRISLSQMIPLGAISSTWYCLAKPGHEYLVYFPESGDAKLDLRGAPGNYVVEWFIPLLNRTLVSPHRIEGDRICTLSPPTELDAVLYLKKK
jgi:hypothetical protein